jgi:hypothetical protein
MAYCECISLVLFRRSGHMFEKYSNIKLNENPSSGSRSVACDGRTDMTKLNVAFRNIANAPKNRTFRPSTGLFDTTQALYLYRAHTWENPQWMLALCISTLHTPCDHYAHVSIQQCYNQSVQPFLHSRRQHLTTRLQIPTCELLNISALTASSSSVSRKLSHARIRSLHRNYEHTQGISYTAYLKYNIKTSFTRNNIRTAVVMCIQPRRI